MSSRLEYIGTKSARQSRFSNVSELYLLRRFHGTLWSIWLVGPPNSASYSKIILYWKMQTLLRDESFQWILVLCVAQTRSRVSNVAETLRFIRIAQACICGSRTHRGYPRFYFQRARRWTPNLRSWRATKTCLVTRRSLNTEKTKRKLLSWLTVRPLAPPSHTPFFRMLLTFSPTTACNGSGVDVFVVRMSKISPDAIFHLSGILSHSTIATDPALADCFGF